MGVLESRPVAEPISDELSWQVAFAAPPPRGLGLATLLLALLAPVGLLAAVFLDGGFAAGRGPIEELASRPATFAFAALFTWAALAVERRLLERSETRIWTLALTDPLTGLFNRRYFEGRLAHELALAARYGQKLSLLLIDVDHLKAINDELGHEGGDRALTAVARAIRSSLRATDVSARLGGDEFAVLVPHATAEDASALAGRVRDAVADAGDASLPCRVTVSIGISDLETAASRREELLVAADGALYVAKTTGRDRVVRAPRGLPSGRTTTTRLRAIPPAQATAVGV